MTAFAPDTTFKSRLVPKS